MAAARLRAQGKLRSCQRPQWPLPAFASKESFALVSALNGRCLPREQGKLRSAIRF